MRCLALGVEGEEEEAFMSPGQVGLGGFSEDEGAVGAFDVGELVVQGRGGEDFHAGTGGFFAGYEEEGDGRRSFGVAFLAEGDDGMDLGCDAGFGVDGAAAGKQDGGAVEIGV